jgi:hypothetical protein
MPVTAPSRPTGSSSRVLAALVGLAALVAVALSLAPGQSSTGPGTEVTASATPSARRASPSPSSSDNNRLTLLFWVRATSSEIMRGNISGGTATSQVAQSKPWVHEFDELDRPESNVDVIRWTSQRFARSGQQASLSVVLKTTPVYDPKLLASLVCRIFVKKGDGEWYFLSEHISTDGFKCHTGVTVPPAADIPNT